MKRKLLWVLMVVFLMGCPQGNRGCASPSGNVGVGNPNVDFFDDDDDDLMKHRKYDRAKRKRNRNRNRRWGTGSRSRPKSSFGGSRGYRRR